MATINQSLVGDDVGDDYADLSGWESATRSVAANTIEEAVINGALGDSAQVWIRNAGATRSATQCRRVTVASGLRNDGLLSTTEHLSISVSNNYLFNIGEDYFNMNWVHGVNPHSGGSGITLTGDNCNIANCIMEVSRIPYNTTQSNNLFSQCIGHTSSTSNNYNGLEAGSADDPTAVNCTIIGGGYNVEADAGTYLIEGCVLYGANTQVSENTLRTNSSHSATDEASPGYNATNWVSGIDSADFTNAAGGDYSPASGSDLIAGTPDPESILASWDTADYTVPRTDVAGNTRPSGTNWDIGAFQRPAAGGSDTSCPAMAAWF